MPVAKKPRTRLTSPSKETRKTKFHIEESTGQASHHHMMHEDLPSSAHQVVAATSCKTSSHPSTHVVIEQPNVWCMASEEKKGKKSANSCIRWLKSCRKDDEQLKWAWVVHNKPTPIKATGETIRSQFICCDSLKTEMCDLMLRLFGELDDMNGEPTFRHFLPAEWAALTLEHGSNLITEASPAVRSMFSGPHISYDVKLCRMIIAPVQCRKGEWSGYVWDFTKMRLSILDPLINESGSNGLEVQSRHDSIKQKLHRALLACRAKYCRSSGGCDHQESCCNDWPMVFIQGLGGKHVFKRYNSGMYMLHFARAFDGQNVKTVPKVKELAYDSQNCIDRYMQCVDVVVPGRSGGALLAAAHQAPHRHAHPGAQGPRARPGHVPAAKGDDVEALDDVTNFLNDDIREVVCWLTKELPDQDPQRRLRVVAVVRRQYQEDEYPLARKVYEHPSVSRSFDIMAWINSTGTKYTKRREAEKLRDHHGREVGREAQGPCISGASGS
ncbi:hypothetical protein EJB05_52242 [Eragrostis curvula]|uniref:Uncharacterized protein n=1 Tax=Eragrostis curvula TaxID=38414 RepID=A0A5J9STK2_9POAL|nr:hypothetical protein EJB05_52242 [Eragrostis curvula]